MPVTDSDDWRVTVSLTGQEQTALPEAEEEIRGRLGRSVAVGAGDTQIFLYADTEAAARDAGRAAVDVLAQHGRQAQTVLHRWHPIEEQWETSDVAMPQTEAEQQAERQRLEDSETAESEAAGVAQWQVRVELGSHREAVALARTLQHQGQVVIRRWKFLIIGASNQDEAAELAEWIKGEAPPDAAVHAEQSGVGWPFIPS